MHGWNLSFRDKLLVLGIALTVGPLLLFVAVMWRNNHQLREIAYTGCQRAAEADLDHIAESIYRLCDDSRSALEHHVRDNLYSAKVLMDQAGAIGMGTEPAVNWEARNQFTKAVSNISLPKVSIGGKWLVQVHDTETQVPVVDAGVNQFSEQAHTLDKLATELSDVPAALLRTTAAGSDRQSPLGEPGTG